VRSTGEARVWRFSAFPVGPAQASPTGVGIIVVDITDSKRVEEQAHLDRRYLAALIESSPLAMVALDEDNRVLQANAAFEQLFLVSRQEIAGRDLDEIIVPPADREEARRLTQHAQEGGKVRVDTRRLRRDGALVDVRVHAAPILLDGRHVGAHVIYESLGGY